MMLVSILGAAFLGFASAQNILQDPIGAVPPVTQGQALEIVHLYYDGYPTAIAVDGASGRKFSAFPPPYQSAPLNYTGKYTIISCSSLATPNKTWF